MGKLRTLPERAILRELKRTAGKHDNPQVVEEHGGQFVSCLACGALWSVQQNQYGDPLLEELEYGDESCNR